MSIEAAAYAGLLTNTERPPQNTSGGLGNVVGGLAIAVCSCIGIGDGFSQTAQHLHGSRTNLNSTSVSDVRARRNPGLAAKANQVHERLLTATIGVQTREALAALGITKSQMAEILGIQRPHLYAWIADKVERADKGERLRDLLKILVSAGISSRQPLRSHLLTEPLEPGAQPLITLLKGKDLSTPTISSALATAVRLNRSIDDEAAKRQARMRASGHQATSDGDAQATLEATLTMMGWDHA
jgi:transcriptional regulator with XRE-family HTH domain